MQLSRTRSGSLLLLLLLLLMLRPLLPLLRLKARGAAVARPESISCALGSTALSSSSRWTSRWEPAW